MKGTYYNTKDGKRTNLFNITFNKEKETFFDVELLNDSTDAFKSEEQVIKFLKLEGDLYNPIENRDISFSEGTNMDLYIITYATYYTSAYIGMVIDKGNDDE